MNDRSAYEVSLRDKQDMLEGEDIRLEREARKYYNDYVELDHEIYRLNEAIWDVKHDIHMNTHENQALKQRLDKLQKQ